MGLAGSKKRMYGGLPTSYRVVVPHHSLTKTALFGIILTSFGIQLSVVDIVVLLYQKHGFTVMTFAPCRDYPDLMSKLAQKNFHCCFGL